MRYASKMTDGEWARIEAFLPPVKAFVKWLKQQAAAETAAHL